MSDCDDNDEEREYQSCNAVAAISKNYDTVDLTNQNRCDFITNNFFHVEHANNVHYGDVTNKFLVENPDAQKLSVREIKNLTRDLKQKLRKFYNDITLPCVSWMSEGEDFALNKHYVELQLDSTSTRINLEEIFNATKNGKSPKRILIEGQPGFGKTTLSSKIIYDWAKNELYVREFELAFLIPLRELQGNSIRQALVAVAEELELRKVEKALDIIEKNMHTTLLVLDGLDEISDIGTNDVEKILYGQLYGNMTVVITCRTDRFNPKRRKIGGVSVKNEFCDKLVRILGVGVEDRINFLRRFVQEDTQTVLERVQKLTMLRSDMFQSPLLLILLSYFVVMNIDAIKLTTRTTVYKTLVNFIIRRSAETRKNIILDEKFSIFGCASEDAEIEYKNTFREFGELCFTKVISRELQFECNDLTTKIYEMGFLAHHKKRISFKSEQRYEAFHLTLMEFAAAFALACEFRDNNFQLDVNSMQNIINLQLNTKSPVLLYLISLLEEKAVELFQQMKPFAYRFSTADCKVIWQLLAEYKQGNSLSPITTFIPAIIDATTDTITYESQSPMINDVFKECNRSNKNFTFYLDFCRGVRIPLDFVISKVTVLVRFRGTFKENSTTNLEQIFCRDLCFVFTNVNSSYPTKIAIEKVFLVFCAIRAEKKSLILSEFTNWPDKFKYENVLGISELTLHRLGITLTSPECELTKFLYFLLKLDKIQILELTLVNNPTKSSQNFSQCDVNDLLTVCSKCKNLDSLKFHCKFPFDIHLATGNGCKQWKTLIINTPELIYNESCQLNNSVDNLILQDNFLHGDKAIRNLRTKILHCKSSILGIILRPNPLSYIGCHNIVELMLTLDNAANKTTFWTLLSNFKQLKMFGMIINFCFSVTSLPIQSIVNCLKMLPITRFAVVCSMQKSELLSVKNVNLFQFLHKLFHCAGKSIFEPLSTIDIIFPHEFQCHYSLKCARFSLELVPQCDLTRIVKRLLQDDIVKFVNIVNIVNSPKLPQVNCEIFNTIGNILNVDYGVYSFDDGAPESYRILFDDFYCGSITQMVVTKQNC